LPFSAAPSRTNASMPSSPILRTRSGGAFRGYRLGSTATQGRFPRRRRRFGPYFMGDNRDQRAYGYWATLGSHSALRVAKRPRPFVSLLRLGAAIGQHDGCRGAVGDSGAYCGLDKSPRCRLRKVRSPRSRSSSCGGRKGRCRLSAESRLPARVFTCTVKQLIIRHLRAKPRRSCARASASSPTAGSSSIPFAGSGTTRRGTLCDGTYLIGADSRLTTAPRPSFGWGTTARLCSATQPGLPPPRRSQTRRRNGTRARIASFRTALRGCGSARKLSRAKNRGWLTPSLASQVCSAISFRSRRGCPAREHAGLHCNRPGNRDSAQRQPCVPISVCEV